MDEGDELDEGTIVAILDMQFTQGRIPEIREAFNRERRLLMQGLLDS
jgi:hypothetical protein